VRVDRLQAGQYALSIKYNDRLHHFPIAPTDEGKFYIGKHNFSTIENVVIYYKKNALFVDPESGQSVTLGKPLAATR
jgi:SH2 domain